MERVEKIKGEPPYFNRCQQDYNNCIAALQAVVNNCLLVAILAVDVSSSRAM